MLPLTQIDIAHAVALTPVHVNRTLMELSRRRWLTFRRGLLNITAFPVLAEVAGFDAAYLDLPANVPDVGRRGTLHVHKCAMTPAIHQC
jgi:Crp-like helix-turn-helix domain